MNRKFQLTSLLLVLMTMPLLGMAQSGARLTQSFVPETGFYWNSSQPGRGYAIEIQDRTIFLTIYTYTEDGNVNIREPLWFSAVGNVVSSGSGTSVRYRFDDELFFSEDGQCLGCNFVDPVTTATGRDITLVFDTVSTATLTIDGEVIPIQRFWYTSSIQDAYFALFGQWIVVTDCTANASPNCYPSDNSLQPFEADLLQIDTEGSEGGDRIAEGIRMGTNIDVAGAYNSQDQFYVIVVAETTQEFLAYYFFNEDFGTDQIRATAERFAPGNSLDGSGYPAYMRRISDRTYVETGTPTDDGDTKTAQTTRNNTVITPRPLVAAPGLKSDDRKFAGNTNRVATLNSMVSRLTAELLARNTVSNEVR